MTVSLRSFLGESLARKYLDPEPPAITRDMGHDDCPICEEARGRGGSNQNSISSTDRRVRPKMPQTGSIAPIRSSERAEGGRMKSEQEIESMRQRLNETRIAGHQAHRQGDVVGYAVCRVDERLLVEEIRTAILWRSTGGLRP